MRIASFALFAALLISPGFVSACSCVMLNTCKLSLGNGSVFVGKVISLEDPGYRFPDGRLIHSPKVTVKFSVEESFRGVETTEVEVSTNKEGASCGYPFKVGESYLVYAGEYEGKLSTGRCSGTQPAVTAAALIPQLRAIKSGKTPASIFGFVSRLPRANGYEAEVLQKPIAGAEIKISGKGGHQFSTQTEADGMYEFRNLPADEYDIQPVLPRGSRVRDLTRERPLLANVENEASSCQRDIRVEPDSKISGRVQSSDGQPVQGFVMLALADPEAQREAMTKGGLVGSEIDADGRFELLPVWPGRYRLRLIQKTDRGIDPRNNCFYPQTIEVAEGQQIDSIVFQVCAAGKN